MRVHGAMSLTYDGCGIEWWDHAVDELERFGLRGTFYGDAVALNAHIPLWREAQMRGHEVGNGALVGSALPDGSLPFWEAGEVLAHVEEVEEIIRKRLPFQSGHSLALPVGADRNEPNLRPLEGWPFPCRGGRVGFNWGSRPDADEVHVIPGDNLDANSMSRVVNETVRRSAWTVMVFQHPPNRVPHHRLCAALAANEDRLDVRPFAAVATERSPAFRLEEA